MAERPTEEEPSADLPLSQAGRRTDEKGYLLPQELSSHDLYNLTREVLQEGARDAGNAENAFSFMLAGMEDVSGGSPIRSLIQLRSIVANESKRLTKRMRNQSTRRGFQHLQFYKKVEKDLPAAIDRLNARILELSTERYDLPESVSPAGNMTSSGPAEEVRQEVATAVSAALNPAAGAPTIEATKPQRVTRSELDAEMRSIATRLSKESTDIDNPYNFILKKECGLWDSVYTSLSELQAHIEEIIADGMQTAEKKPIGPRASRRFEKDLTKEYWQAFRKICEELTIVAREKYGLPEDTQATALHEPDVEKPTVITSADLKKLIEEAAREMVATFKGKGRNPFQFIADRQGRVPDGLTLASFSALNKHLASTVGEKQFQVPAGLLQRRQEKMIEDEHAVLTNAIQAVNASVITMARQRFNLAELENDTAALPSSEATRPQLTAAIMNEELRSLSQYILDMEMTTPLAPPAVFSGTKAVQDHLILARQTFAGMASLRGGNTLRDLNQAMDSLMEKFCSMYAVPVDSSVTLPPMATTSDGKPAPVQLGGGATMRTVSLKPGETFVPKVADRRIEIQKSRTLSKELWTKIYKEYIAENFMLKAMFHSDHRKDVSTLISSWQQVSQMAKESIEFPVTEWAAIEQVWGLWEGALILHPIVTDPIARKFFTEESERRKRNLERLFFSLTEACDLQGKPHLSLTAKPELIRSSMLLPETVLGYNLGTVNTEGPPTLLAWVGQQPIITTHAQYVAFQAALAAKVKECRLEQYGLRYDPAIFDAQLERFFHFSDSPALQEKQEAVSARVLTSEKWDTLEMGARSLVPSLSCNFSGSRAAIGELIRQWDIDSGTAKLKMAFPITNWAQIDQFWRDASASFVVPNSIEDPLEKLAVEELIAWAKEIQQHFYDMAAKSCDLEGMPTLYTPDPNLPPLKGTVLLPELALAYYFKSRRQPPNMAQLAEWAGTWPPITCSDQLDDFLKGFNEPSGGNGKAATDSEKWVRDIVTRYFTQPQLTKSAHFLSIAEKIIKLVTVKAPTGRSLWAWFIEEAKSLRETTTTDLTPVTDASLEAWTWLKSCAENCIEKAQLSFPLYRQGAQMMELIEIVKDIWRTIGIPPTDTVGRNIERSLWIDARFRPIVPPIVLHNDNRHWPIITALQEAWSAFLANIEVAHPLTEAVIIKSLQTYAAAVQQMLADAPPDARPHLEMWIFDTKESLSLSLAKNCHEQGWTKATEALKGFVGSGKNAPPAVITDNDVLNTLFTEWKHATFSNEEDDGVMGTDLLSRLAYHFVDILKTGTLKAVTKDTASTEIGTAWMKLKDALIAWHAAGPHDGELDVTSPPNAEELTLLLGGLDRAVSGASQSCQLLLDRHLKPADRLSRHPLLASTLEAKAPWPTGVVLTRNHCPSLNSIEKAARDAANAVEAGVPDGILQMLGKEVRIGFKTVYDALLASPLDTTADAEDLIQCLGGYIESLRQKTEGVAPAKFYAAIAQHFEGTFREWIGRQSPLCDIWTSTQIKDENDTSAGTTDATLDDAENTTEEAATLLIDTGGSTTITAAPTPRREATADPSFKDDIDFATAIAGLPDAAAIIAAALQELAPANERPNGELASLVRDCVNRAPDHSYATIAKRLWLMLKSQRKRPGFLATAREFAFITQASEFAALLELYRAPAASPEENPTIDELETKTETSPSPTPNDETLPTDGDVSTTTATEVEKEPRLETRASARNEGSPRGEPRDQTELPTRRERQPLNPDNEPPTIARPSGVPQTSDAPPLPARTTTEIKDEMKKLGVKAKNLPFLVRQKAREFLYEVGLIEEALTVEEGPEKEANISLLLEAYKMFVANTTALRKS